MKKNFMAIASLLIAAMLLVVSCAPEANVEGKVEDGLVEAVIGLGRSAKDITITDNYAGTHITYYYTMNAAWKASDTGAPIYGEVKTETKLAETDSFIGTVPENSLGKVTPGLWNIEVKGYTTTESAEKDKLVLEGKASAYFNGSVTKATVFVSPVSSKETEKIVQEKCIKKDENALKNDACITDSVKTSGKVSINTATKEELMSLTGIGDSKAEDIIKYREENGLFKTIEDIKNVSGIGDSLFAKIKENITT